MTPPGGRSAGPTLSGVQRAIRMLLIASSLLEEADPREGAGRPCDQGRSHDVGVSEMGSSTWRS